jgi:hypothetical protein
MTLFELMVAIAIAGILATLSIAALQALVGRARARDGALEATSLAQLGQALASSTGVRHALLVSVGEDDGWLRLVRDDGRRLATCLAANPAWVVAGDFAGATCAGLSRAEDAVALDARLRVGPGGGVLEARGPAASCPDAGTYGPPFCEVPGHLACTFCSTVQERVAGVVVFEPRGEVRLLDGDGTAVDAAGGTLVLEREDEPGEPRGFMVTRLGIVRSVGALGED